MIVFVSVSNEGGELSQPRWAQFATQIEGLLIGPSKILGVFYSRPDAPWQSACWRVEIEADTPPAEINELNARLVRVSGRFEQPVTWEAVPHSETLHLR